MKQTARQVAICAVILAVLCLGCRMVAGNAFLTYHPLPYSENGDYQLESLKIMPEEQGIVRVETVEVKNRDLVLRLWPEHEGRTYVLIQDDSGEDISIIPVSVDAFMTIYNGSSDNFTGHAFVLAAVTLFWLLTGWIMMRQFFRAKGYRLYRYATVFYVGFGIFALVAFAVMLAVTLQHILDPAEYGMIMAVSSISGAARSFMNLTAPLVLVFSIAMAVSNLILMRHEGKRTANALGLIISVLLILGELLGWIWGWQDFSGSEWENRLRNTFENVYATVFVYFECMLAGTMICGLKAARYEPKPDRDFIIILGCWFRKDGTLPPLLRGRVDRAIAFWRKQKEQTGKEAVLIPSGGQGKNESMPEAEAMRRYMLDQGIPDSLIVPETQSRNTWENMAFSKAIIEKMSDAGKILFATTNYHVFRSGIWADSAGLQAEGIGSRTKWWYWPNAFMRECIGLMQKSWKQELFLLILFVALYGALSLLL